jgi:predicted nucleotidyltransferase
MEYQALSEFTRRVSELFSGNFVRAALFGSKARGESHPESDLDVAVVMRSVDSAIKMGIFDTGVSTSLTHILHIVF